MRHYINICFVLCLFITKKVIAVPWPLGDGQSGWESIYPVMRTYGNYDENAFWAAVDENYNGHTFHNAIDLSPYQCNTENVRAVELGYFTDCSGVDSADVEWYTHIFPENSEEGWHYGNVQGDDGSPTPLEYVEIGVDIAQYGDLLGTMAELEPATAKHLHFFRTDQTTFTNGIPGIDDPLDLIDINYAPIPANGYT